MKNFRFNPISIAISHALLGMSAFDAASFAAGSFEGEGDTRRFQFPEGREMNAVIVGPFGAEKATRVAVSDKGAVQLLVVWQPDDPQLQNEMKLQKLPTIIQRIFLDIGEDGRSLDMGPFKNGQLNALRETFGLNRPGVRWSFADFIGKAARITIKHGVNKEDPTNPFMNIGAVKAL